MTGPGVEAGATRQSSANGDGQRSAARSSDVLFHAYFGELLSRPISMPTWGRHGDQDFETEHLRQPEQRRQSWQMVPRLQSCDGWLRHIQQSPECRLRQAVVCPVPDKADRHRTRGSKPLPFRAKLRVAKVLFQNPFKRDHVFNIHDAGFPFRSSSKVLKRVKALVTARRNPTESTEASGPIAAITNWLPTRRQNLAIGIGQRVVVVLAGSADLCLELMSYAGSRGDLPVPSASRWRGQSRFAPQRAGLPIQHSPPGGS